METVLTSPLPPGRSPVKSRLASPSKVVASPAAAPLRATASPRTPSLANIVNAAGPSSPSATRAHAPPSSAALASVTDAGDVIMEEEGDDEAEVDDEMAADHEEEGDEDGEEDDEDDEDDDDDDDDEDSDGDESEDLGGSPDVVALDGPDGVPALKLPPRVKSEPADAADADAAGTLVRVDDGDEQAAPHELKPKKKNRARQRSPSSDDDLPAPPPPLPTIRVSWPLVDAGVDDFFEVSFAQRALEAGYPMPYPADDGDGGDVGAPDMAPSQSQPGALELGGPLAGADVPPGVSAAEHAEMLAMAAKYAHLDAKPKKGKRKIDYDLNDPFIDDSDLQIDAPTHVARPKQEGFFVHAGPLELMEGSPPPKPKRRPAAPRPHVPRAAPLQLPSLSERIMKREALTGARVRAMPVNGMGSPERPIAIDFDDDDNNTMAGPSRLPEEDVFNPDRALFKNAPTEDKYMPPYSAFPDEVAMRLRRLRRLSLKHKWDLLQKNKFPEHLKPPLQRAGEAAFRHDVLCVFDKAEFFGPGGDRDKRWEEKAFVAALCGILPYNKLTLGKLVLKLCYTDYIAWLVECEKEGLRVITQLVEAEAPRQIENYETALEEYRAQHGMNSQAASDTIANGHDDDDGAVDKQPAGAPLKKFYLNEEIRAVYTQLLNNAQEQADLNKKMDEWGVPVLGVKNDQTMRRDLYGKVKECFPEGYMTTNALSREMTRAKSKNPDKGNNAANAATANPEA